MKNIFSTIKTMLLAAAVSLPVVSMHSCNDYLDTDKYFNDMTSLDSVFLRQSYVDAYIRGASALLPDESRLFTLCHVPFNCATDEMFTSFDDDYEWHPGNRILLDEITYQYTTAFHNWPKWYQGIRKANLVLARIDEVPDMSAIDRRDFIGRCYFLRGYFYYMLLAQYGPCIIMPETVFDADASVDEMSLERNTYDECVEYICKTMESAIEYLPDLRESSGDVYLPTKGAAMAVITRVRLNAASPWYNGNRFYNDWTTSDGRHFINQEEDNSRWAKAAVAAKRIIGTAGEISGIKEGTYALYTAPLQSDTWDLPANVPTERFPNGAGDIDPYRSYSQIFVGEIPAVNNPELIYCSNYYNSYPAVWLSSPGRPLTGSNGLNITQDMVDAYRMKDGRDINNSSADYPYPTISEWSEPIGQTQTFSGYELRASTSKMYENREPRFYSNIGFSHRLWKGSSYSGTENYTNLEVTYYKDQQYNTPQDGYPNDYNRTGYTFVKYNHDEDNYRGTIKAKTFPVIRYAEVLLNYAEALNELNGTYTETLPDGTQVTVFRDTDEIKKYFNQVRYRAGLPGLTDAELADQATLREVIKRERQVEFMCEGQRYHDLRRWGDAEEAYNRRITGMNINATSSQRALFYQVTVITDACARRTFSYKNYFYPIPKGSMDKNSKLVQNPGW